MKSYCTLPRLGSIMLAAFLSVTFRVTLVHADTSNDIAALMERVRKKEPLDVPALQNLLQAWPALDILAEINKYGSDPDARVREQAVSVALMVAKKDPQAEIQQTSVNIILRDVLGNPNRSFAQRAADHLSLFSQVAFTAESKQMLGRLMMEKVPQIGVLLAVGIAEMEESQPRLKEVADKFDSKRDGWWNGEPWAAHLALARMGDKQEIKFCIETVEHEPSASLRVNRLLQDLNYIRQPETVEVLKRYLMSDEVIPASPPDVPSAPYANSVLPLLLVSIGGLPEQTKGESRAKWMSRVREWIKLQPELKINR